MKTLRTFACRTGLLVLAAGLLIAGARAWRGGDARPDDRIVLRLVHDMLHASVRTGFEEVRAGFATVRPDVRLEIIEVPGRMFPAWRRTRLIGKDAPDLMRTGAGIMDEELARYFMPLTPHLHLPNPYNRGTELEHVAWKDTFIDGLEGPDSFSPGLMEYFGVSTHSSTFRIFCNLDLLREITGEERLPATFDELVALCESVEAWSKRTGRAVLPIAAFIDTPSQVLRPFVQQQTQRLSLAANFNRSLSMTNATAALTWLRGDWSLDSPELRHGFELMRVIGRHFQPSFMQADRSDAGLMFLQGRAVMISAGAVDSYLYHNPRQFRSAVFRLPPVTREPYTGNAIGPVPETGINGGGGTFGILRDSPHYEAALEFLHYFTSQPVNRRFAEAVQRMPTVVGVEPAPALSMFAPEPEGWPAGIAPDFPAFGARAVERLYNINLHRLVGPQGSTDDFLAALSHGFADALTHDVQNTLRRTLASTQRDDTIVVAHLRLAQTAGVADRASHADKASRAMENQVLAELEAAQLAHAIARRPSAPAQPRPDP